MTGTIVIREVSGAVHRLENKTHAEFMKLGDKMGENAPIFIVGKDRHTFINPQHIVTIEWLMP